MNPTTQAIAAALGDVRASVKHRDNCGMFIEALGSSGCDCLWRERAYAAIAEAVARAIEAAATFHEDDGRHFAFQEGVAALRVPREQE